MINLYTPERSFQAFKQTIVDCTDTSSPTNAFLMNRETISGNTLEEFYIPFDYVNENAKIFVIGITPGTGATFDTFGGRRALALVACETVENHRRVAVVVFHFDSN